MPVMLVLCVFCLCVLVAGCQMRPVSDPSGALPAPPADTDGFPSTMLSAGEVHMLVMLPDADGGYYRGVRFAWHGMVRQVWLGDATFFGFLHDKHRPQHHDSVSGPAAEFDIDGPTGAREARPGESFVKIGVGRLRRTDEPRYAFSRPKDIVDPGRWTVEQPDGRSLITTQDLPLADDGYAYRLTQTLELDDQPATLRVTWTLENTGRRELTTEFYHHNFLSLDGETVGPNYLLQFPWPAGKDAVAEKGDHADGVMRHNGEAVFIPTQALERGRTLYLRFTGYDPGSQPDARFRIEHRQTGQAVEVEIDRPMARFAVWASPRAFCPEPFTDVQVQPGESATWVTTYRFTPPTAAE
jgi:hypothetical protein